MTVDNLKSKISTLKSKISNLKSKIDGLPIAKSGSRLPLLAVSRYLGTLETKGSTQESDPDIVVSVVVFGV